MIFSKLSLLFFFAAGCGQAARLAPNQRMGGSVTKFLTKLFQDDQISEETRDFLLEHYHDYGSANHKNNNVDTHAPLRYVTNSDHTIRRYLDEEMQAGRISVSTRQYLMNLLRLRPVGGKDGNGVNNNNELASASLATKTGSFASSSATINEVVLLGQANPSPPNQDNGSSGGFNFNSADERYNGIWGYTIGDREYALQCHSNGLHIIDVTDPSGPFRVQFIPMPGGSIWRDVETHYDSNSDKTFAYVAAQSQEYVEDDGTLFVVDLSALSGEALTDQTPAAETDSNPCEFREIADSSIHNLGHTLTVGGGLLFLNSASGGGCHVYDLQGGDPWNPQFLGASHEGSEYDCHDSYFRRGVVVDGQERDILYAADGYSAQWTLVDVTDIRNGVTTILGATPTVSSSAYAHSASLDEEGHYLYVCEESQTFNMAVFDVSDPRNPTLVTTFEIESSSSSGGYFDFGSSSIVHNSHVRGDRLFVAYYEEGFVVFDISNRSNPQQVGSYKTFDGYSSLFGSNRGAWNLYPYLDKSGIILVSDQDGGTFIFELSANGNNGSNAGSGCTTTCTDIQTNAYFDSCSLYNGDAWFCDYADAEDLQNCCTCGGGNVVDNCNTNDTGDDGGSGNPAPAPSPAPPSDGIKIQLLAIGTDDSGAGSNHQFQSLFQNAQRRWAEIIKSDLEEYKASDYPDMDLFDGLLADGVTVNQDVDDVLIGFYVGEIDGAGGTLGYAGPIVSRVDDQGVSQSPISGLMVFDQVDFAGYSSADIELIIIHEMGHVLGYGAYQSEKCGVDCESGDYSYTCDAAQRQHDLLGLPGTLNWSDEGEAGSKCVHLDDDSFCEGFFGFSFCSWSDVMSPVFDSSKEQIISAVSIGVFEDLGYQVNYDAADDIPAHRQRSLRRPSHTDGVFGQKALKPEHTFRLDQGEVGRLEAMPASLREKLGLP